MTRYYSKDHEWVEVLTDGLAVVGITDFAQKQLGDIVYVELPAVGKNIAQGQECAVVESVKAASEVYMPIDGEVVEVNQDLQNNPGLVNQDPLQEGWIIKMRPTNDQQISDLMQEAEYETYLGEIH